MSLEELSEDLIVNVVGYFSFKTRLSHSRINRKFNRASDYWWNLERSFPFLCSYSDNEVDIEKNHTKDLSPIAKQPVVSVMRYNFKLIPAVVKCRQLTELNLFFAHTPFFFKSNHMLSALGSKLVHGCPSLQSISLLNGNLGIVSDYLNGLQDNNQINYLDVRCSQNEDIDLDQFVALAKSLALFGVHLDKLSISFPPGKSPLFSPIKKNLEIIGGRLTQLWSPKFYMFRPKEKLTVLGLDQLTYAKIGTSMSKVATDCPNITAVIGYVHPSQSNLDAIGCWSNLSELHLSNFKSSSDYEKFRVFLMSHGHKLKILHLKDLLEVYSSFWPNLRSRCTNLESLVLKHVYSVQNSSDALSFEISQMRTLKELHLSYIVPGFDPVQIFTILRSKMLQSVTIYGHQEHLDMWSKEVNSFNQSKNSTNRTVSLTGIVFS